MPLPFVQFIPAWDKKQIVTIGLSLGHMTWLLHPGFNRDEPWPEKAHTRTEKEKTKLSCKPEVFILFGGVTSQFSVDFH